MNNEKSLQDIIFSMLCNQKYVFYGLFLAELNKHFDEKFPTACVGKHPDSVNISLCLGEHFWSKVCDNDSKKRGVLIHELEHVIREHLSEMSNTMFADKMVANIAMDIAINQTITEELPRTVPVGAEFGQFKAGEKIGAFIEDFSELKLRKDESSLYYYGELMKAKEKKQQSSKSGGAKNPEDSKGHGQKPGNQEGTSGCPMFDSFLDGEEKYGDWHSKWKELTEGMGEKENELFRKEIQEQLRRVAEETQKLKGDIPVHISNSIKENFGYKEPVISWKTLFNRFVGSAMTTDVYQSRKRPNFRFEDAPSNKYKSKIRIVVGMDSSGSVSDHELEDFFGQVKHMFKAGVKIDVCMWDAHVHTEYEYKGENKWERVCQGGTRASSFIEYVNENKRKKNWTCAITLTDGYIESQPVECSLPMLWVITSTGSTDFEHKCKKIKINS